MSRLMRDGTAKPVSRDQFSGVNGDRENAVFTCSADHDRIDNLTRLISILLCGTGRIGSIPVVLLLHNNRYYF